MRRSVAVCLALVGVVVVMTAAGSLAMILNWPLPLEHPEWGFPGFQGTGALVFVMLGAAVVVRRPDNPIGWLLQVAGVLSAAQFLGHQIALYGLIAAPGAVPHAAIGTWVEEWIWLPIIMCMGTLTFLLFPTGRFLSPRWRIVGAVGVVSGSIGAIGLALLPLTRFPGVTNPIAPDGPPSFAEPFAALGISLVSLTLAAGSAALVVRFRHSSGIERQQLKWLAIGALLVGFVLVGYLVTTILTGDTLGPMAAVLAITLFTVPATIALAMLRHGLYEVDRLLNKTVVYGLMSVVLLAIYAGSVLLMQPVLRVLTSGDTVAVAISTLVAAAVFQPVRHRIQEAVDRRFFRSRYDATVTVARLAARLRDEVDYESIGDALMHEVATAVRPSAMSIWSRQRR